MGRPVLFVWLLDLVPVIGCGAKWWCKDKDSDKKIYMQDKKDANCRDFHITRVYPFAQSGGGRYLITFERHVNIICMALSDVKRKKQKGPKTHLYTDFASI